LPLPSAINPEVPEAVERVVLKAMAKAPEDRYQKAGDLTNALSASLESRTSIFRVRAGAELVDKGSRRNAARRTRIFGRKLFLPLLGAVLMLVAYAGYRLYSGGVSEGSSLFARLIPTNHPMGQSGIVPGALAATGTPISESRATYLSQLRPLVTDEGYGEFSIGVYQFTSPGDPIKLGDPIQSHGKIYREGLFAHAPSLLVYDLDRAFTEFSASIAIDDRIRCGDGAVFVVEADGVEAYRSPTITSSSLPIDIHVDVKDREVLRLITEPGTGGDRNCDWTVWGDPTLYSLPSTDIANLLTDANLKLYDDFDDPLYDGGLNLGLWSTSVVSPGHLEQADHILSLTLDPGGGKTVTAYAVRDLRSDRFIVAESKMLLSSANPGHDGDVGFALMTTDATGQNLVFLCVIYRNPPIQVGCEAYGRASSGEYSTARRLTNYDIWHTVRIAISPEIKATFYVDGRQVGSYAPKDAEELKGRNFVLRLEVWSPEEGSIRALYDDVRIGQFDY
jgi:hypothetical protein